MVSTPTLFSPRSVRPPDLDAAGQRAIGLAANRPAGRPQRRPGELPLLVLSALVLAFVTKTFLVQAFYIPSGSMLPTLEVGDRVLVEKVTFRFREPARGEVIVFRRPGAPEPEGSLGDVVRTFLEGFGVVQPRGNLDLIKRVVGLPGETVEIRAGVLHVDGRPLDEPYIADHDGDFPPTTVPQDSLFLMGDNRGNSDDSRGSVGPVPRANVVGKAFVILWPPGNADLGLAVDHREPPG